MKYKFQYIFIISINKTTSYTHTLTIPCIHICVMHIKKHEKSNI